MTSKLEDFTFHMGTKNEIVLDDPASDRLGLLNKVWCHNKVKKQARTVGKMRTDHLVLLASALLPVGTLNLPISNSQTSMQ